MCLARVRTDPVDVSLVPACSVIMDVSIGVARSLERYPVFFNNSFLFMLWKTMKM